MSESGMLSSSEVLTIWNHMRSQAFSEVLPCTGTWSQLQKLSTLFFRTSLSSQMMQISLLHLHKCLNI